MTAARVMRMHVEHDVAEADGHVSYIRYIDMDDKPCDCRSYDMEHALVVTGITEFELRAILERWT